MNSNLVNLKKFCLNCKKPYCNGYCQEYKAYVRKLMTEKFPVLLQTETSKPKSARNAGNYK